MAREQWPLTPAPSGLLCSGLWVGRGGGELDDEGRAPSWILLGMGPVITYHNARHARVQRCSLGPR